MLWDECCDRRPLLQHFFLLRSGHRELPSVPPFPHWDLLVLRGAQCPGHRWQTHALVHNDEVSELMEIEGVWKGEQKKQVFMF